MPSKAGFVLADRPHRAVQCLKLILIAVEKSLHASIDVFQLNAGSAWANLDKTAWALRDWLMVSVLA